LLLLLGASVGAAGIWLAYRWYVLDPEAPARFVARIPFGLGPGMYAASVNKYYVDDLYGLVWARGGVLLGNALWWFDAKVIDGAVNGAGWVAQRYGALLRRTQTGHVQNYALGMAAGLVVVLVAFLVFRA
jgi:NADH-quinone oxidoreductase subunit L